MSYRESTAYKVGQVLGQATRAKEMSQDLENLRKLFEARSPVPENLHYENFQNCYFPDEGFSHLWCDVNLYNALWQGFLLMADELTKRDAEIARLKERAMKAEKELSKYPDSEHFFPF